MHAILSRWLPRLALPILLVWTLTVFGQVINFDFVDWDDTTLILGNPLVKHFALEIFWIFEPELYAPLSLFTFQIEHWIAGFSATLFHLTNLLLHLVNVILVYRLIVALLSTNQQADVQAVLPAVLGTALFAIHPFQAESVAWVSARKELLWTTFGLLALLEYLRGNENIGIRNGVLRWIYRHRVWLLTFLALLSKATAVMIPVLMLAIDAYRGNFSKTAVKEKWGILFIAIIFGLLGLLGKTGAEVNLTLWNHVVLMPAQIIFALRLLVWPFGYAVLHPAELPIILSSATYWVPAIIVVAAAAILWKLRKRLPLAMLGLTIFFLTLLPGLLAPLHANIVTLVTEHYLYFPLVGLAIVAVSLVRMARHLTPYVLLPLLVVLGLLAGRAFTQVSVWRDTITLFESVREAYPRSPSVLTNLGAAYARAKRYAEAESVLRQAVHLGPDFAQAHYNLGGLRYVRGDYAGAIAAGIRVVELQPNHADGWRMLTWSYYRSGDLQKAREAYDTAIHLRPAMRDQLPDLQ